MSKDLTYYRLLPYEREWSMREDDGHQYFLVRLKDIPAIAGDGVSRDEAVEDLRSAFDEFILAWLAEGVPIPEPRRGFTVPVGAAQAPAKERPSVVTPAPSCAGTTPSWTENAKVYTNDVLVQDSANAPSLASEPVTMGEAVDRRVMMAVGG
jgi:predicted RNase H-like HicB family nuclease